MKTAQEVVDLINAGRGSEAGVPWQGIARLNEKGEVVVEITVDPVSGDATGVEDEDQ